MGPTSIDAPQRNYADETRDTLQAQIDLAPEKYQAEATWGPKYQDLQMGMLEQATPRLLDLYENDVVPRMSKLEADATRSQREADITAVKELGPEAIAALKSANPEAARLMASMTSDAQAGLNAGSRLTPDQLASAQQSSRSSWASRGLASSPASALDEVLQTQLAGSAEQDRRRGYASNVFSQQQSAYGDPFMAVLGRPSNTTNAAGALTGQAGGYNPGSLFQPESQYSADIYGGNAQGKLGARTANAANQMALISSGMEMASGPDSI